MGNLEFSHMVFAYIQGSIALYFLYIRSEIKGGTVNV